MAAPQRASPVPVLGSTGGAAPSTTGAAWRRHRRAPRRRRRSSSRRAHVTQRFSLRRLRWCSTLVLGLSLCRGLRLSCPCCFCYGQCLWLRGRVGDVGLPTLSFALLSALAGGHNLGQQQHLNAKARPVTTVVVVGLDDRLYVPLVAVAVQLPIVPAGKSKSEQPFLPR